ncbi:response regulator [Hirschia baltica]|uniref:Response regulator receiver protein n=1 Tax=Hirschia baltica (strain ATCC 49814 / DSM 5838 / IFAM 1418) TaxID=582402 RepID=C6XQK5_HIRBI|nr:response regulator [Hirschia baltica]ACT58611.1 response regulator receiver protein [Hirschia baltica ATCC 49814]
MYSDSIHIEDVRKKRRYDPRNIRAVVAGSNRFNRNLMLEIMRTLGVLQVDGARCENSLFRMMDDQRSTIVFIEWSDMNDMDVVHTTQQIRKLHDDNLRRVPIIAISSQLTKEMILEGRNAGIDEFLRRPCSPADVEKRLRMVIETPRPFVDSKVYIGPCRRRKNPADYHGPRRRDRDSSRIKDVSDAERQLVNKKSPMAVALTRLKMTCELLSSDPKGAPVRIRAALEKAMQTARQENDHAIVRTLQSFGAYIEIIIHSKGNAKDARFIINTGVTTLEQLLVLPREYDSARETVSNAFADAIQRRMAA